MTDNTTGSDNGLQSAFGDRGTNVNAIAYGHPHGEKIVEKTREVLSHSKTGKTFLSVMDSNRIPVQIMKGMNESGFSPDSKTIYLQVAKSQKTASGEIILKFTQALSEADQEYGGMKAPDPMTDVMGYAQFMHSRNLNALTHMCMVVQELTDTEYFPILLDSLRKMGFNDLYKAYVDGASRRELYDYYAEAYNRRS